MLKISAWLLRVALKVRIRALEAELARHVAQCAAPRRRRRSGEPRRCYVQNLEDCDASQFCPVGRALFDASFDLNEVLHG